MTSRFVVRLVGVVAPLLLTLASAGLVTRCTRPVPSSAREIVLRSVIAHGGMETFRWNTITVTGRVRMQDGIAYNAAYRLWAQAPDKVRVEHDLTADRGRAFYEYFLNGDAAWTRRNLIVSPYSAGRARWWLDQCQGVAFYYHSAAGFEQRPDTEVVWPAVEGWRREDIPGPRPAYVITAFVKGEARELAIDKETYLLLVEKVGNTTRYLSAVRGFRGVKLPTRILEVVRTQNRETATPFVIETVAFNARLDPALFTEDMPKAGRTGRGAAANPE